MLVIINRSKYSITLPPIEGCAAGVTLQPGANGVGARYFEAVMDKGSVRQLLLSNVLVLQEPEAAEAVAETALPDLPPVKEPEVKE